MELSFDATQEAVDWVSTLLATIEYTGEMQTRAIKPKADHQDGDGLSDRDASDWAFTIHLYLPDTVDANSRAADIVRLLSPLHRTGLITEPEAVVVKAPTASNLVPQRIGRFVVLPATAPDQSIANEITLRLPATLAFGSGLHPATMLSLQLLERHVLPPMNVLDLGSGSGILSVAIAKLGAQVLALDNDRMAVQATQAATRWNGVEQQVTSREGSLGSGSQLGHWLGGSLNSVPTLSPAATFDLIVANILARIHLSLTQDYRYALRQTAQTGFLITAGFTIDYEAEINAALVEAGFAAIDRARSGEWVALVHRLAANFS